MSSTNTKIQTELSLIMPVSYYLHRAPGSKTLAILIPDLKHTMNVEAREVLLRSIGG